MIVVTGAAGFIGSAVIWRLNLTGEKNILAVDSLRSNEKWKNLLGLSFCNYLDKGDFIEKLENGELENIDVIFHLGACSSTTQSDENYLIENNYRYTLRIAQWIAKHPRTRLIYASSAATYGNGENGYLDNEAEIEKLRPLNCYGYSKQLFDLKAKNEGWLKNIVGLKYFNVFGPNEYHKGDMKSVICKAFENAYRNGRIRLFKSYNHQYRDGEQLRDFIYVKNAVDITLFFWNKNRNIGGLFNVGTGIAKTWNDVAKALFCACGRTNIIKEKNGNLNSDRIIDANTGLIEYTEMPETLKNRYQYYTCADISKLRDAGYNHKEFSIENAIDDYVKNYLIDTKYLGDEK
ncbi:MAG: ADP-glyceromanno-heptose 6-epimerase [Chitinispirillales bacterium]|jgi:ADP-L-glycero-D-manno-heptose 6-epimerase|nr:ADP-glyceromanno-heptose 6-epimerase [Chitinispirillales bacterium]